MRVSSDFPQLPPALASSHLGCLHSSRRPCPRRRPRLHRRHHHRLMFHVLHTETIGLILLTFLSQSVQYLPSADASIRIKSFLHPRWMEPSISKITAFMAHGKREGDGVNCREKWLKK